MADASRKQNVIALNLATALALAARTADFLISHARTLFHSDRRDLAGPPVRRKRAPPGTLDHGVPRWANR